MRAYGLLLMAGCGGSLFIGEAEPGFAGGEIGDECGNRMAIRPDVGAKLHGSVSVEIDVLAEDSIDVEVEVYDGTRTIDGQVKHRQHSGGWRVTWEPSQLLAPGIYDVVASYEEEDPWGCSSLVFTSFEVVESTTADEVTGAWVLAEEAGVSADAALLVRLLGLGQRYRVLSVGLTEAGVTLGTRARDVGYPAWPEDGDEQVSITWDGDWWTGEASELTWTDTEFPYVLRDAVVSGAAPNTSGILEAVDIAGVLDLSALTADGLEEACALAEIWGRDCEPCGDGSCVTLDARLMRGTIP